MQAEFQEFPLQEINVLNKSVLQNPDQIIAQLAKKLGTKVQALLKNIKKYRQEKGSYQKYDFPTIQIQKEKTKSTLCAKILTKGTKAFKCHQCMFEANSILCVECFQKSDHKGHMFQLIQVFGGCCDCGDQEKWDIKGSCCEHNNSDILQQIKIDPQTKKKFTTFYKFSIYYLFHLFQKLNREKDNQEKKKIIKEVDGYGTSLFQNLYVFNVDSLVSNLMTVSLFSQAFESFYPQLNWLKKVNLNQKQSQLNLIEVLFQCLDLQQTGDSIVTLFTSLFTIKEFKKALTIIFCQKYNRNPDFAMGSYNHLSCQLLTSHQLIQNLIKDQKMQPLYFQPNEVKSTSYEEIAQNFVRYYIDIEYLSKLHKDSAQKYVTYHIMKGNISDLAGYRQHCYKFQDSINYFGIELIYISKIFKIVQKIKTKNEVLIKGIQDLFEFLITKQFVKTAKPTVYISQERSLSLFIFAYFENNDSLSFEQKIKNLIQILGLNENNHFEFIDSILKLLNYNIEQSALVLGHPQSYDRFYTYYCFTFKKNMLSQSLDFYLYKILMHILKHFSKVKACQLGDFIKTLLNLEQIFDGQDFLDDDESIFDRRKSMLNLYYFINLIIQLSETNIHDLIIGMKIRPENYQNLAIQFFLSLIKTYNKILIKDLKNIVDTFFQSSELFQKFINSNQNILIEGGKVSIIEDSSVFIKKINTNYLKCFKNQLVNLEEVFTVEYKPCQNSFSTLIFEKKYVQKAIQIAVAYRDILIMKGGKIRQKQSGVVCSYIKELLKLQYCLKSNQQISQIFLKLFKGLSHDKKSLQLFDPDLIKQLTLAQQYSKKLHENMKEEQKQRQEDRKRKLLAKKKRKIAKFKQTHQKISINYKEELKNLQTQILQEKDQNYQGCIICRQKKFISDDIMLMGYMQNSDLFYQYLKGKEENNKNYNMVFKTCGHQIHNSCHIAINGNREYSQCQLCKSTINALFPLRIQQVKINQNEKHINQKLIKDIEENITRLQIINVVIDQNCQNGFGVQFSEKRGITQQLIEGFVNQFIFSGLLNEIFFIKKQLPIYSNLLKSLKLYFNKKKPGFEILKKKRQKKEVSTSQSTEMKDQRQQEKKNILEYLEIYIRQKVFSFLFGQIQKKSKMLSQKIINKIDFLFDAIIQNKVEQSLRQIQSIQPSFEQKVLKEKISFFEFPENIQVLIQQIGKCPNCLNFTNMVMICVLCSWHGCKGCQKQSVFDHTHKKHNGNSVYIQGDIGCIYFVSRKRYWIFKSIYEDYLGDSYGGYVPGVKLFKYVRGDRKLKQLYQDIIQHQIQQKIRYEQNTKKKSFNLAI